ncbi:MAG TPA: MerR family transcriptional regulator [Polyangiaceae bacterium]|nr:MerR family transcriptional regulator [Polyangiaceae bacterium]
MTRKHDRWTKMKARLNHRRPKTPAPKNGWLLKELAELAEVPASTVRYYVQQRLLRPIERRGTATRYERGELMRLLGFLRLKGDDSLTLAKKKERFEAWGDEEMAQWLRAGPLPPKAAQALGMGAAPVASAAVSQVPSAKTVNDRTGIERWQRITLLPGLELMLNADAKGATRIVAQRIIEEYLG